MADYVTVKDVLEAPEFSDARLLGGKKGVTNEVRSVAVAEIPDIAMWLSGYELVHTTGRYFANDHGGVDEELFYSWVYGIIQAKSACLAVKTHRFIGEIPGSIIKLGDEYDFPIIEFGESTTQALVSNVVYRLLTEHKIAGIEERQQILASFIHEMAEAHSRHFGVNRISEYLNTAVMLFDENYNLIEASRAVREKEFRMLDIPRRVRTLGEMATIPTDIAVDPNVCRKMQPLYAESSPDSAGRLLMRPIASSERILGYCVIHERKSLSAEKVHLFVTLADVLVADLTDRNRARMAETIARRELFAAILAENPDAKTIAHRATLTGLRLSQDMRMILLSINGVSQDDPHAGIGENVGLATLQAMREIYGSDRSYLVSTWEQGVAILLFGDHPVADVKRVMQRLVTTLEERNSVKVVCGIGTQAHGISEVIESAQKSNETLTIVKGFNIGPVDAYETLGHYLMFASFVENPNKAQDYVNYVLGPLIDKEETYPGLIESLEAFLNQCGSYTAAARELHMHVNTMRYRVDRIDELLPVDISTLDGRGAAWLALRVYQYFQN